MEGGEEEVEREKLTSVCVPPPWDIAHVAWCVGGVFIWQAGWLDEVIELDAFTIHWSNLDKNNIIVFCSI